MRLSLVRRGSRLAQWSGILISLVLLIWVLSTFDLAEVGWALHAANYLYMLPVAVLLVLNFAARSLRWGTLFDAHQNPKLSNMFSAMTIGYLTNNILPARTGDLVRVYVLGQQENIAKSTVLATVVVERVADLLVALALLAAVLLFYPLPAWLGHAGLVVAAISFVVAVVLALLSVKGARMVALLVQWLSFVPGPVLIRIESMGTHFVAGLSGLRVRWHALQFMGYTVLIWIMEVAGTFLVAQSFGLDITMDGALFVILVIGLGSIVPSSPGYIGTYEFFAVSALSTVGITGSEALSFTLVMHAVTFLGTSLLGVVSLALTGRRWFGGLASLTVRAENNSQ